MHGRTKDTRLPTFLFGKAVVRMDTTPRGGRCAQHSAAHHLRMLVEMSGVVQEQSAVGRRIQRAELAIFRTGPIADIVS